MEAEAIEAAKAAAELNIMGAYLPPLMRTSKSTLDLEVNHAVACVRIA